MALEAIKSISIYLWFEIILQKYGKGATYFEHDCLKNFKSHFLGHWWYISTQFAIIWGEISILQHFNTKKSP
tara:strand:+ start:169 stop:384 length:216 start_codon:yes stop_codon:yes gene_type:complete